MGKKKNRVSGYWLLVKDIEALTSSHISRLDAELVADCMFVTHREAYRLKAMEMRENGRRFTIDLKPSDLPTGLVSKSEVRQAQRLTLSSEDEGDWSAGFAVVAKATAAELAHRDNVNPSELEPEDFVTQVLEELRL